MLDLSKIVCDAVNPQKHLKTRDGRDVWIYWVEEDMIHGYLKSVKFITNNDRVSVDWTSDGSYGGTPNHSYDLIMTEPAPVEAETFDWRTAIKLFADGVEIEYFSFGNWFKMCRKCNWTAEIYRRKPVVKPDVVHYSNDYGDAASVWIEHFPEQHPAMNSLYKPIGIIKRTKKSDGTITYESVEI